MAHRGAEFGEVFPRTSNGLIRVLPFLQLPATGTFDIDNDEIVPITDLNAFRMGQQIIMWWAIANPIVSSGGNDNWITRLRLKLWWLRPNLEYRAPGTVGSALPPTKGQVTGSALGWKGVDRATFGDGPNAGQDNNRFCWIPSPKRLDTTPFATPPPPVAPAGNSDSILLDDILTWDLQDPNLAAYADNFSADQVISRQSVIMYPAMGYALGVTAEATFDATPGGGVPAPPVRFAFSYITGTLGAANYQESMG